MKKLILIIFCGLFSATSIFAATQYTSPASGYVVVTNVTAWNAIPWTTASIGGTMDEYVIQSGYTIQIGSAGSCNVTLGDVLITLYGRIGFKGGNNDLVLGAGAVVNIEVGGQFGFGSGPDFQGNSMTQLTFGATSYSGGFLAYGPDQIDISSGGFQTSYLWTGLTSTAWNNGGNWQTASGNPAAPTSTSNVIIPGSLQGGSYGFPQVSGAYSTKRLTVYPSGQLTILSNGSLTTNDSLHVFGTLTVKSGGALVQTTASKSCDYCPGGSFDIERQTSATSPWYVGSPIVNLSKSGFSSCGNAQFSTTTCDPPVVGGTAHCVMSLDQDATISYNCSHNLWSYESSGTFTSGKGYALYRAPGTFTFSGSDVNNGTVSYGPLGYSNKGDVNLPSPFIGTTTRGWHMVSNPYPSPITILGSQLTSMGFDAQIQLWFSTNGNWVSPNPLTPVTIAVGQAFQIKVSGSPGNTATFTLDNSYRVATTGATFYKTEDVPQQHYINMTLSNGTASQNSTAMVYFEDGATPTFDGPYDVNRLFGLPNLPYLYTVEQNGEYLCYNALPPLTPGASVSVPVGIQDGIAGNLSLLFEGVSTTDASVALEDLKTGVFYPVTEGYVHNFTTQAGDSPNRFVLHFQTNGTSGITNISANTVSLFPNPTTGRVTMLFQQNHGFNQMVVSDLEGKVVFVDQISQDENNKSFDAGTLPAGVYTIKLTGATGSTLKLVKL